MGTLVQDIRFGLRMLAKNRGFTAFAVLTLALGIGANTAMFSVVNAVLLRPPVAKDPEQLVGCYNRSKTVEGGCRSFSYPNYVEIRDNNPVFSSLLAFDMRMIGLEEGDITRRVFAAIVSANYFSTLGVNVALGRDFLPVEEQPGGVAPVVILSHDSWRRIGSDPDILGKMVRVNGKPFEIVGVAPEHFTGTAATGGPAVWFPLGTYGSLLPGPTDEIERLINDRNHCFLMLAGRLKPGLTMKAAEAQLQVLAAQLEQAYPVEYKDRAFVLARLPRMGFSTDPSGDTRERSASLLLMSGSVLVLLIACLNLANMQLARGAARHREIAVRMALGGGRWRILRQLLTEGLLLSLLGGAAGLVLACWTTHLLAVSLLSVRSPFNIAFVVNPDLPVLGATLFFCVLATVLSGFGPALKLSRRDVVTDLKEQPGDERRGKAGTSLFAPRNLLVMGQITLSLVLLATAALCSRSAHKAAQATPGYSFEGGLLAQVDARLVGYDEARARQLYLTLLDRLRGMPGVESVSLSSCMPFGSDLQGCSVKKLGGTQVSDTTTDRFTGESSGHAILNVVGKDYFRTLGLPLLLGRDFDRMEVAADTSSKVVIIDEPLARKLWPNENALGQRIQLYDGPAEWEIVGVARGLRHELFDKGPRPHVYVPFGQFGLDYVPSTNLHLKVAGLGRGAEAALIKTVRDQIRAVDEHLPVLSIGTLSDHHEHSMLMWLMRSAARLSAVLGLLALFLAATGVYAVKAYVVARRTREIGIRMALGATTRDVLWMVLREGVMLTVAGGGVGLLLTLAAGRVLSSKLYDVSPTDPLSLCIALSVITVAAMLACYLPARRAAKVNPMVALRYE